MPTAPPTPPRRRALRNFVSCLVLVAAALPPAGARADQPDPAAAPPSPIDLRSRWTQGQTARFAFTTQLRRRMEITLGDRRREQSTDTDLEGEVTWVVQQVNVDGGARGTMTLDWMSATTRAGDNVTVVDSRRTVSKDGKAMHQIFRAMAKVPVEVDMAPDGRVKRATGLDAMHAQVQDPGLIPDALDFQESASGLAQFAAAPPPLAVGEAWDAAFRWNHELGKMDEDWRFRLESVETVAGVPLATITGTAQSRLEVAPEQTEVPEGTPPLRIKLEEREAEMRVLMDLGRGEAVGRYSRVKERVVAEMKLPAGVFRRVMHETVTSDLIRLNP